MKPGVFAGVLISIGGLVSRSITIIGTIILARILTPEDFGVYAIIISATAWLAIINSINFDKALIVWNGNEKEIYHSILILAFIIASISMVVVITTGYLLSKEYEASIILIISIILAMGYFIGPLYNTQVGFLSKKKKFKPIVINDILLSIFAVILGVSASFLGAKSAALAIQAVFPFFLVWFLFRKYLDIEWPSEFSKKGLSYLYRFGVKQNVGNFLELMFVPAILLVMSSNHPISHIGEYSQSLTIRATIVSLLILPINRVLFPKFVRDGNVLSGDILKKVITTGSILVMPISGGIFLFGKGLILFVLGDQWVLAGEIFSILGISFGMVVVSQVVSHMLIANGRQKIWISVNLIAILSLLIMLYTAKDASPEEIFKMVVFIEISKSIIFLLIGGILTKTNFKSIVSIPSKVIIISILSIILVSMNSIPDYFLGIDLLLYLLALVSLFLIFIRKEFIKFFRMFF